MNARRSTAAAAVVICMWLAGTAYAERAWRGTVGGLKDRGSAAVPDEARPRPAVAPVTSAPLYAPPAPAMRRSVPAIERPSSLSRKSESPKIERRPAAESRPAISSPAVRDSEPTLGASPSRASEDVKSSRSGSTSIFSSRAEKSGDAGEAPPRSITIGHSREKTSRSSIFTTRGESKAAASEAAPARKPLITPKAAPDAEVVGERSPRNPSTAKSGAVSVWKEGREKDLAESDVPSGAEKGIFAHTASRETGADAKAAVRLPGSPEPSRAAAVDKGSIRLPGSEGSVRDNRAEVKRDYDSLRAKVGQMRAGRSGGSTGSAVARPDAPSAASARSWSGGSGIDRDSLGARTDVASRITRPLPPVSRLTPVSGSSRDFARRGVPASAFYPRSRPPVVYYPRDGRHGDYDRHDHDDHHGYYGYYGPIFYEPAICHPVVARPWWAYGCPTWCWPYNGFAFGYHGKHWSIWLSDVWPSAYYSTTLYVESPVYYTNVVYESAPRVIDTYDRIDVLVDRLKYGDVAARKDAADELGRSRTLRALYPLVYALEYDAEPIVRYHAARALGRLGYRDALPALRRSAETDPEEVVRTESADSVEKILEG